MEQLRLVNTPAGPITYTLIRKKVKNLNLRVKRGSSVILSIPLRCPEGEADAFIREKCGWVVQAASRMREIQSVTLPPELSRAICMEILRHDLETVYPLVAPLGVALPQLKLRKMRSQWGNCHWRKGYITLNTALARCPEELRSYVILHELVHFLHHDHGPGFYAQMDALMPDWQNRRRALRGYVGTLMGSGTNK